MPFFIFDFGNWNIFTIGCWTWLGWFVLSLFVWTMHQFIRMTVRYNVRKFAGRSFVQQTYRGAPHRLARRLLDRLLEHAVQRRIDEIFLGTTEKFRAAHRFYEKSGFTLVGERALPDRFPRMNVDTRFYRLRLAGA